MKNTFFVLMQVHFYDPKINMIEQDYLIWYHENKSVMWHVGFIVA